VCAAALFFCVVFGGVVLAASPGASSDDSDRDTLRQFRSSDGVITLTNRPSKYVNRKGYAEVQVKYEPVYIPAKYKRKRAVTEYTSNSITDLVTECARRYRVPEKLIYAVIRAESNFNPYAVSRAGARGLMQLMPGTAEDMGVTDIFDPAQNIAGGTQYLAKMLELFDDNLDLALAAYNAGPGAVKKFGGIPPYQETQQYVKKVRRFMGSYGRGLGSGIRLLAAGTRPKLDSLPEAPHKGAYVIHLRSGLTQLADRITDEDPYYHIQSGEFTTLVRKELVTKIVRSA